MVRWRHLLLLLFSWTPQSLGLLLVKLICDQLCLDRGQVVVVVVDQGRRVVDLKQCCEYRIYLVSEILSNSEYQILDIFGFEYIDNI